jgi:malonyl CoA-acyl carrier protein transacylase
MNPWVGGPQLRTDNSVGRHCLFSRSSTVSLTSEGICLQVRLAVAGAFHTHFMGPAVEKLEAALAVTDLKTPRIPVISNVDAEPHSDPVTIKKILAQQVGVSALHTKLL